MTDWIKYNGYYNKRWYDIKLKSGVVVEQCYPNAGYFHSSDGMYSEDEVEYYRGCKHPLE